MSANNNYDVIIVGCGSVGNPTAYQLAEAGLKVLVIDKRASAGQGENKTAIGGVRATHSDPGKISTCLFSIEVFSTWEEKSQAGSAGVTSNGASPCPRISHYSRTAARSPGRHSDALPGILTRYLAAG